MVNGDKAGLREIYENYLGYIYRIVYEILQSKENAEDVTSEFFIRLWNKAEQYKPGNGHKGYLATMSRNMAIDFLRRHRREELTELLQDMGKEEEEGQGGSELLKKSNVNVEEEVLSNLSVKQPYHADDDPGCCQDPRLHDKPISFFVIRHSLNAPKLLSDQPVVHLLVFCCRYMP